MNNNFINSHGGFYNIQLSDAEIQALLQILSFATSAANIIAGQEIISKSVNAVANAAIYDRMALEAKDLINIISSSVSIGEPAVGEIQ